MISEVALDRAFADKLAADADFRVWILERTKFKQYARFAVLLQNEQIAAKPRKLPENWWRNWWCTLEDGSQSETDIFATFQLADTLIRFALHIEDKPPHGQFTPNQYLNYKRRADFMARKKEYMDYVDSTTILLAPAAFISGHARETSHFDCLLPYEVLALKIPLFAESLAEASANAR